MPDARRGLLDEVQLRHIESDSVPISPRLSGASLSVGLSVGLSVCQRRLAAATSGRRLAHSVARQTVGPLAHLTGQGSGLAAAHFVRLFGRVGWSRHTPSSKRPGLGMCKLTWNVSSTRVTGNDPRSVCSHLWINRIAQINLAVNGEADRILFRTRARHLFEK